jgi:hypothetical protein
VKPGEKRLLWFLGTQMRDTIILKEKKAVKKWIRLKWLRIGPNSEHDNQTSYTIRTDNPEDSSLQV